MQELLLESFAHPGEPLDILRVASRYYFANGKDRLKRYDPTSRTLHNAGMLPPSANPAIAKENGAYNLSGTHKYRITEYDEVHDQESDPFGADMTMTGGSGNYRTKFTSFPTKVNSATTHFRIYRTVDGGLYPTMAMAKEADADTPGTQYDNTPDTNLSFTSEGLNIFNGDPPGKAYMTVAKERLFLWGEGYFSAGYIKATNGSATVEAAAGSENVVQWTQAIVGRKITWMGAGQAYDITAVTTGGTPTLTLSSVYSGSTLEGLPYCIYMESGNLRWSVNNRYESFPDSNVRWIDRGRMARGTGIGSLLGSVILFFRDACHVLSFDDDPSSSYADPKQLSESIGCIAHRTIRNIPGRLVWLSKHGLATTDGHSPPQLVTEPPTYQQGSLRSFFEDIALDENGEAQEAVAVVWRNLYICAVPSSSASSGCDKLLVWDFVYNQFTIWEFPYEIKNLRTEIIYGTGPAKEEFILISDVNGYSWQFPSGDCEGYAVDGTVDSVNSLVMTDSSAAFPVAPDENVRGLEGHYLTVVRGASKQRVRITANTVNTITVAAWDFTPQADDVYYVGAIESYYKTARISFGVPERLKKALEMRLAYTVESDGDLRVDVYKNQDDTPETLSTGQEIDLAGAGDIFNEVPIAGLGRIPLNATGYHLQFKFGNEKPDEPWEVKEALLILEASLT